MTQRQQIDAALRVLGISQARSAAAYPNRVVVIAQDYTIHTVPISAVSAEIKAQQRANAGRTAVVVTQEKPPASAEKPANAVKPTPQPAAPDYNSMTVAELRPIAKAHGIAGYSRMRKADLITTLQKEIAWEQQT